MAWRWAECNLCVRRTIVHVQDFAAALTVGRSLILMPGLLTSLFEQCFMCINFELLQELHPDQNAVACENQSASVLQWICAQ